MKNTVYTVTPPDLKLSTTGPNILLLGVNFNEIDKYISVYDELYATIELTFFVSETGITKENIPWYRQAASAAHSIIVNISNLSVEEMFLAMQAVSDENIYVFWLYEGDGDDDNGIVQLLNSYKIQVFNDMDGIAYYIKNEQNNT